MFNKVYIFYIIVCNLQQIHEIKTSIKITESSVYNLKVIKKNHLYPLKPNQTGN